MATSRRRWHLLLALGLTLSGVNALSGQTLAGQVIDSVTTAPVGRGFVVLVDTAGQEIARTLSTADGRFLLPNRESGEYRLRSERIGYRVWESEPFRLTGVTRVDVTLRISAIPTSLPTIEVAEETECRAAFDGINTGTLWAEGRKALLAASWSAAQRLHRYRMHHYDITRQNRRDDEARYWATEATVSVPFAAVDVASLVEGGFIQRDSTGAFVYFGPDANVLLDDRFHATHCFGTKRGSGDERGLVGLTFRPLSDRDVPDIEGVLWFDESSFELRRIEFEYTELPVDVSRRDLGGTIVFQPTPSGAWIITEWEIRMPVFRSRFVLGRRSRRSRRTGTQSGGSLVIEAFDPGGERIFVSPHANHIRGTAYDSIRGGPLAHGRVLIAGYETRSDGDGRFALNTLLTGKHRITLARLDSLGFTVGNPIVDLQPGDTADVQLVVPALPTVRRQLCGPADDGAFAVFGRVTRITPEITARYARVTATWTPAIGERAGRPIEASVETNNEGMYTICSLPTGHSIRFSVRDDDFDFDPVTILWSGGLVVRDEETTSFVVPAPEAIWRLDFHRNVIIRRGSPPPP